jgi:hypothetical protein
MRWLEDVTLRKGKNNVYKVLVGKLGEERPLGRPKHEW